MTFIRKFNLCKCLVQSTVVSEFKNDVDLVLTKRCLWHFKDESMLSGNVTHCRCPNREQTAQADNDWERMRMGKNGSKQNKKNKSCYKILLRKYKNKETI